MGAVASGEATDEEEGHGQQDGSGRDRVVCQPRQAQRQVRLIDIPQRHQRQDEQHAGVGMTCAPEVLPQRILGVGRVADEQCEEADSAADDGRHQEQERARQAMRFTTQLFPPFVLAACAATAHPSPPPRG